MLLSINSQVRIIVEGYIVRPPNELPTALHGKSVTPASNYLLNVSVDAPKLQNIYLGIYYHHTMQLLHLSKRYCPNLLPRLFQLKNMLRNPSIFYWNNTARMCKYLEDTKDLLLTLEIDGLQVIMWCVVMNLLVHYFMYSHNRIMMTLVKGYIYGMPRKQKLNTKNSNHSLLQVLCER